ncbi:hypothetical protein CRG98_033337 [Punica granatum]|uniref:Uncharacterized protein n=1 Tax=Punica granatum TaxID=22663 RepID=A0A2I0IQJ6_PUNGR|nr:hypothetical protein CRG98_033337 [Punica granatum]
MGSFFGRRCDCAINSRGGWVGLCSVCRSSCVRSLRREGWALLSKFQGLAEKEGPKYNASFEIEVLSRFSTAFGARAYDALESTNSGPRLLQGSVRLGQLLIMSRKLDMNCLDSDDGERTKVAASEEEDAPTGVPASLYEGLWSLQAVRTEFRLVGARMRAPSHDLGVSTFPWGRVMDKRKKELPLPVYDPKVDGR